MFINYYLAQYFSMHVPRQQERLLDLGCGQLPYFKLYAHPARDSFAADIEPRTANLSVISAASSLPFPASAFDTVILSEVIEHVFDERTVLDEICRVLKPDGILLITWPFNYGLHEEPYDYTRRTIHGMKRLLHNSDFELVEILRRGDVIGVLITLIGQLALGATIPLCRLPYAGKLFYPIQWAIRNINFLVDFVYFKVTSSAERLRLLPEAKQYSAVARFLVAWSLGYCVTARKVDGRNA